MAVSNIVVFDMDGLLIDTEALSLRAFRTVRNRDVDAIRDDFAYHTIGYNQKEIIMELTKEFNDEAKAGRFWDEWHGEFNRLVSIGALQVKRGSLDLLRRLSERGVRLSVATASPRRVAIDHLSRTHLLPFIQFLVTSDEVKRGKPAPDTFLESARLHEAAPSDMAVFEDSFNGVRAAHAAGCRVVMVPDLRAPTPEIEAKAWRVISSLEMADDAMIDELLR